MTRINYCTFFFILRPSRLYYAARGGGGDDDDDYEDVPKSSPTAKKYAFRCNCRARWHPESNGETPLAMEININFLTPGPFVSCKDWRVYFKMWEGSLQSGGSYIPTAVFERVIRCRLPLEKAKTTCQTTWGSH